MTIVNGDILRTAVNFSLNDGTQVQNVYHHKRTGIGVITDAVHVATLKLWAETMYDEVATWVRDDVIAQLATVDLVEWQIDEWVVVENIGTFTPTFNPLSADEALPNQVSPFVVFKTERPKTVGRKFLFPFNEASQAGSYLVGPAVTAIVAYADDAVNDITIQALDYLVPGVVRTGVNSFLEFAVAIVTNVLGSQRRRRPGVGS